MKIIVLIFLLLLGCASPKFKHQIHSLSVEWVHQYANGNAPMNMTAKERLWCKRQANLFGGKEFDRKKAEKLSDKELAQWTLDA